MKTVYQILIYFMNLTRLKNVYMLGKLNQTYYIYKQVDYMDIASISIKQIMFFHIPILKLGDAFYTYTKEEQEFVLYHELAHFKLKHYLVFVNLYDTNIRDRFEYEADNYAGRIVGKETALKALIRTRNILINLKCDISKINERIKLMELNDECICN